MSALETQTERLVAWTREHALPMWGRRARDHRGGFYEALLPDGTPCTDMVKRFRVQPRQAYVYAHAETLGWTDQGRSASDHAWAFALEAGTDDRTLYGDGDFTGFVHLLTPEGGVQDARRDTYDHAFVLLACAWRIEAFGDEQAREVADRTMGFLDGLRHPEGGFEEGRPAETPRRQNPHMHLFEASMAMARATGEDRWRALADEMHALFTARFWDGRVLREFFARDWSLDDAKGDLIEPGHMAEWVWLLDGYEALTSTDQSDLMDALYEAAEATGRDPGGSPFLIDEARADGTPTRATRRAWVQTEYAKAMLVRARRGQAGAGDRAAALIEAMLGTYLDAPLAGGWNDQYGADGAVVSPDMPTSTFYHVLSLAAEAARTAPG